MTVQELIDSLQQIKDKTLPVTIDAQSGYDSVENVEVDSDFINRIISMLEQPLNNDFKERKT